MGDGRDGGRAGASNDNDNHNNDIDNNDHVNYDYNNDDNKTAGRFGVHLVREISPWSSQVLCIGLAQNLKPILSDDKYWNINPNISAFGM